MYLLFQKKIDYLKKYWTLQKFVFSLYINHLLKMHINYNGKLGVRSLLPFLPFLCLHVYYRIAV